MATGARVCVGIYTYIYIYEKTRMKKENIKKMQRIGNSADINMRTIIFKLKMQLYDKRVFFFAAL